MEYRDVLVHEIQKLIMQMKEVIMKVIYTLAFIGGGEGVGENRFLK